MTKTNRFLALCLALTMCATLAMTGALGETQQPPETTATASEPAATPATASPEDVLATVNGQPLLRSDIQPIYESIMNQYAGYGMDLSSMKDYVESMALDYAVQNALWKQKAQENGFDKFTAEEEAEFTAQAQSEWDTVVEENYLYYLAAAGETPTEQEIADAKAKMNDELLGMGYTLESVAEYYREAKIQERTIELLLKDLPAFTDEDIQKEYELRVQEDKEAFEQSIAAYEDASAAGEDSIWYVPEGVRGITHILLSVDSELLNNYLDARAELEAQQTQADALAEEGIDPMPEEGVTADPATVTSDPAAAPTADPAAAAPVTQADVDAARQAVLDSIKDKTDAIYSRLAAGEAFAALVEEFGEDPGMEQEPYKTEGYSVHAGFEGFIQEFTDGAFAPELQKVGDYGQPVIGSYGVHILCYTRDVPSGPMELTEARKTALLAEMQGARENEFLGGIVEEWLAAAEITYTGLVAPLEE